MAISDYRITAEDTENKKISDIEGDTLIGTPSENKAKFDAYCELIKERFNTLVDSISDSFAVDGTGYKINSSAIDMATASLKGLMSASDKAKLDSIGLATTTKEGLMSASDKAKMDSLKVAVNNVSSGVTNPPTSGATYSAIQRVAGIASDTADYVVSYEEYLQAVQNGPYWNRRKWASGVCEVWTSEPIGYLISPESWTQASVSGLYFYDMERNAYPSGSFITSTSVNYTPPCEFVHLCGPAGRAWLAARNTVSYNNLKYGTQGYTIVSMNQPTVEREYCYSVYTIGRWKA